MTLSLSAKPFIQAQLSSLVSEWEKGRCFGGITTSSFESDWLFLRRRSVRSPLIQRVADDASRDRDLSPPLPHHHPLVPWGVLALRGGGLVLLHCSGRVSSASVVVMGYGVYVIVMLYIACRTVYVIDRKSERHNDVKSASFVN